MNYNIYISACHKNGGIYRYILDEKGKLTFCENTPLDKPMYLVEKGGRMYTLLKECFPDGSGGQTSFKINADGTLSDMEEIRSTKGLVPCHLAVEDEGIFCVNYSSGSVIKMPDALRVHEGSGPNLPRQDMAHTHFVCKAPNGLFAVTDLGTDEIYFYNTGMELRFKVKTPEGAGVRHLTFSPDGSRMYAVTELYSTVCVYSCGDAAEDFALLGEYPALPADFKEKNTAAAIRLYGDMLYVSNRGHDSIVGFRVEGDKLVKEFTMDCGGKGPRDFDIFGKYLIVTNENSNNVVVFDLETKLLTDTKDAPAPISVLALGIYERPETDIHSHTYYSGCGKDNPHAIVDAAIAGGMKVFGITDHNYGIGERFEEYVAEMTEIREEYKDRIKVLRGIEISILPQYKDINTSKEQLAKLDYCIVEVCSGNDVPDNDFVALAKSYGIPTGIAHTDIFGLCEAKGLDAEKYITDLAKAGIFWEMNMSYDSIHGYREHQYMKEFFNNKKQQEIVKKAGLAVSVGFDGHRVEDYLPERVVKACHKLEELGIKAPFQD